MAPRKLAIPATKKTWMLALPCRLVALLVVVSLVKPDLSGFCCFMARLDFGMRPHARTTRADPPPSWPSTGSFSRPGPRKSQQYAFGCTEEKLRKLVFGLKQIGDPSDNKYDRTKGAGSLRRLRH